MPKNGDENGCIPLFQIFEEKSAPVHPTLEGVTIYWIKLTCQTEDFSFLCSHPCISCFQASFQRSNSHDKVRKIVAEEGRTARNLIAWSVPLENKEDDGMCLTVFLQVFALSFLCQLELLIWKYFPYVEFHYLKMFCLAYMV